jgi:hypothetical protein
VEGSRTPDVDHQPLIATLSEHGLAASSYETDGTRYIHVSPPRSPAAGTLVRIGQRNGIPCFLSEWGTIVGMDTLSAAQCILRWFGKASARP